MHTHRQPYCECDLVRVPFMWSFMTFFSSFFLVHFCCRIENLNLRWRKKNYPLNGNKVAVLALNKYNLFDMTETTNFIFHMGNCHSRWAILFLFSFYEFQFFQKTVNHSVDVNETLSSCSLNNPKKKYKKSDKSLHFQHFECSSFSALCIH